MTNKLCKLFLIACLMFSSASCAAVLSLLPTVTAAVTDASLILDGIQSFLDQLFTRSPDPVKQALANAAISKARAAADLALRTAQASSELSKKDVDEAFASFRQAYADLMVLIGPLGVKEGPPNQAMGLQADGTYYTASPLVLGASK